MQSTMMHVPLNLTHFLERAGKLFGSVEIVSRMPDKTLHRTKFQADAAALIAFAEAQGVVAIVLGVVALGETVELKEIAGAALIALGLLAIDGRLLPKFSSVSSRA